MSFWIDIYYELQLVIVFLLVFPKTMHIKTVLDHLETNAKQISAVLKQKVASSV